MCRKFCLLWSLITQQRVARSLFLHFANDFFRDRYRLESRALSFFFFLLSFSFRSRQRALSRGFSAVAAPNSSRSSIARIKRFIFLAESLKTHRAIRKYELLNGPVGSSRSSEHVVVGVLKLSNYSENTDKNICLLSFHPARDSIIIAGRLLPVYSRTLLYICTIHCRPCNAV